MQSRPCPEDGAQTDDSALRTSCFPAFSRLVYLFNKLYDFEVQYFFRGYLRLDLRQMPLRRWSDITSQC